jgi:hypothetical protein
MPNPWKFGFVKGGPVPPRPLVPARLRKASLHDLRALGDLGLSDVPHGGTGVAALTPYAVLCGGTTGTGPVQPLAAVGTAGQLLTSNGAGALPSFQAAPAPLLPSNILHNGGAEVWQRGTIVSCSDNTYSADRWYALAERTGSNNVSVSQFPLGYPARYGIDVKNGDPVAQRIGIAQVVENADAAPYTSRPITFQLNLTASTAANMRIAVLQWTGTADSVTRDVVNDWTNGTYTTANFFASANLAVLTVSGSLAVPVGAQAFSITATPTTSCKNLIVFIWTEGTVAQNFHFTASDIGLFDGAGVRDWLPRPVAQELAICQRYLLALSTFPMGLAFNGTALYSGGVVSFPTTMRAAPTLVAGNAYAANVGNNGTPQLIGAAPAGTGMNNSGAAWTATAVINFTGLLSAEL